MVMHISGRFRSIVVALGIVLSSFGMSGSPSAVEIQPGSDSAPGFAIVVVDTAGREFLLYHPLVQYQWLAQTHSRGLPEVKRIRATSIVLEEEVSGELHAFEWGDLRSIGPTDPSGEASRILVTLVDGHTYRCMPGYVHPEMLPKLLGAGPSEGPRQVTRTIEGVRQLGGRSQATDVPWLALASIEVYSVSGNQGFTMTRAEALVQEREHLRRRLRAIEGELSQHINALTAP